MVAALRFRYYPRLSAMHVYVIQERTPATRSLGSAFQNLRHKQAFASYALLVGRK